MIQPLQLSANVTSTIIGTQVINIIAIEFSKFSGSKQKPTIAGSICYH